MSQENVEIVKQGLSAFSRRDASWADEHCTQDIELHPAAASAIEGSAYRGRDGIREFFNELVTMFDRFSVDVEKVRAVDERTILAIGRVHARSRGAGVDLDQEWGSVWILRAGRVHLIRTFFDRRQALEAAGLSE